MYSYSAVPMYLHLTIPHEQTRVHSTEEDYVRQQEEQQHARIRREEGSVVFEPGTAEAVEVRAIRRSGRTS